MRKRPLSSVTTILANLVGRSVVSAITQTPASGPFGPLTTPPRSPSPTLTPGGALWCAPRVRPGLVLVLVSVLTITAPAGGLRSGSRADESNAAERFRHISMHSPLPPATASATGRRNGLPARHG